MENYYQSVLPEQINFDSNSPFILIVGRHPNDALYIAPSKTDQKKLEILGKFELLEMLIQKLSSTKGTPQICRPFPDGFLLPVSLVFINIPDKEIHSLGDLLPNFDDYYTTAIFIRTQRYMYVIMIYTTNQLPICRNLVKTIISYAYLNRDTLKIYFLSPIKILNFFKCFFKKSSCRELKYFANKYDKQRFKTFIKIIHSAIALLYQREKVDATKNFEYPTANPGTNQIRDKSTINNLNLSTIRRPDKADQTHIKNANSSNDFNNSKISRITSTSIKNTSENRPDKPPTLLSKHDEAKLENTNILVVIIDPLYTKKKIITHPSIIQKLLEKTF